MRAGAVIAIDGPAGAGKSTVARAVARALGYLYLDSGAMYRAVALRVLREGIDPGDEPAVVRAAEEADIRLEPRDGETRVLLDGEDVTDLLRTPAVNAIVAQVASYLGVRRRLLALQRAVAEQGAVVLEGRDTTTVVAPDAEHKFFLTASLEERIRRRYAELREAGYPVTLEQVREDITRRDRMDATRSEAPLVRAPDAVEIDTTGRTVEEVVALILARCGVPGAGGGADGGSRGQTGAGG